MQPVILNIETKDNGPATDADRAAAGFDMGSHFAVRSAAEDGVSCEAINGWLRYAEGRVLAAFEAKVPGISARFAAWKAEREKGEKVTVAEAVRDPQGRLLRTVSRQVSAEEAARLGAR